MGRAVVRCRVMKHVDLHYLLFKELLHMMSDSKEFLHLTCGYCIHEFLSRFVASWLYLTPVTHVVVAADLEAVEAAQPYCLFVIVSALLHRTSHRREPTNPVVQWCHVL